MVEIVAIFVAAARGVPRCAMNVWRDEESGPLYTLPPPDEPCGCYFDSRPSVETSRMAVEESMQCPAEATTSRHGFCEVM